MSTGRLSARRTLVLGVMAVVLASTVACRDDQPKSGETRLELDGTAQVERQAGGTEIVKASHIDVRVGDVVTLQDGDGVLRLPGGSTVELRSGRGGRADSVLVVGPKPVLDAGDLLVVADRDVQLTVAGTTVVVRDGAARLSRAVGMSAASYTSQVHIDSAGQERDVLPLRQIEVPALGQPPASGSPFAFDSSDPWDRRFLGTVIDLSARLEALSTGYTQNLQLGEGDTAEFFRGVLPGLASEEGFEAGLIDPERRPGETLVGAAIAALGNRGSFEERWQSIFAFRDAGAAWGLVALDQGVESAPLLAAVTAAVDQAPLVTGTGPTTTTTAGPTPSTVPASSTTTTTTTTRPGAAPTTTTTMPPDDGGLLTPILGPLLAPVTDVLNGLVNGLLGGLLGGN
jgi:hypothetical protein